MKEIVGAICLTIMFVAGLYFNYKIHKDDK